MDCWAQRFCSTGRFFAAHLAERRDAICLGSFDGNDFLWNYKDEILKI